MRRVIVSNIVSLDGYHEGPDNAALDLPMDAAFDAYNRERIEAADAVLLGARSYEGFVGYWPGVQHHPQPHADDPMARAFSADNRATSHRYDAVDVLVVSDRLVLSDDAAWRSRTRVVPRDRVRTALADGDGECVVFGSRTMWTGLLSQGLVDEIHLMVGPLALGSGTPVFDRRTDLQLLDVRRFAGSDNVVLVYTPSRPSPA